MSYDSIYHRHKHLAECLHSLLILQVTDLSLVHVVKQIPKRYILVKRLRNPTTYNPIDESHESVEFKTRVLNPPFRNTPIKQEWEEPQWTSAAFSWYKQNKSGMQSKRRFYHYLHTVMSLLFPVCFSILKKPHCYYSSSMNKRPKLLFSK